MTRIILPVALVAGTLASALPAQATGSLIRTFVSSAGNDSNPCTITQPCRTFAAAYNATAAGGIIAALDPAGYGSLNITGPVTVDGNGWAAITAPSGLATAAIFVIAGASDKIVLRGITIDGAGAANSTGIDYQSGAVLVIDDCVVRNMTLSGLVVTSAVSTTQTLAVSNSFFTGNGGNGIGIVPQSSGAITASITGTELSGNTLSGLLVNGGFATGPINVAVIDSVAANNGSQGFFVESATSHSVGNLALTHVQAAGNGDGVEAFGNNATMALARSTVTGNTTFGFVAGGSGIINSYADNYFADNTSNSGSLTTVTKQ